MPAHTIGTREDWEKAHQELVAQENELAQRSRELAEKRRELPWVPVDKDYRFETDGGTKTLAELFDGRSQLLVYHIMFGADYENGACPGCSGLADNFDGAVVHLNHQDVTFVAISRAPLDMIQAYKRRMGWSFPWVSSHGSDYQLDFGFALTPQQMGEIDEVRQMLEDPPEWLREWSEAVGTDLSKGLAEGPGWAVFAREDGVVHHTYSCRPPGGALLTPYHYQLLDHTPKGRGDEFRAVRHDEY